MTYDERIEVMDLLLGRAGNSKEGEDALQFVMAAANAMQIAVQYDAVIEARGKGKSALITGNVASDAFNTRN